MAICKGCGARIEWLEMTSGKKMPVDPNQIRVAVKDPRKHTKKNPPVRYVIRSGFTPHWATCPAAGDFKKKRGYE